MIVTIVPAAPEVGERLPIAGGGTTVNPNPLLDTPATLTTTFPVVAPAGTGTAILVADQLAGAAVTPLNVMELPVALAPKLAPEIVTVAPGEAAGGEIPPMDGGGAR